MALILDIPILYLTLSQLPYVISVAPYRISSPKPSEVAVDVCHGRLAPITVVDCLQHSSRKRPFIQPLILEIQEFRVYGNYDQKFATSSGHFYVILELMIKEHEWRSGVFL